MASLTSVNPRVYSLGSTGVPMETETDRYIKNGESWNAGEFLTIDTAGRLRECVSDEDAATGGIKYIALETVADPGADDTTKANVAVIRSDVEFIGNELDGAVTDANIGTLYGIDVTSNVVTVDVGDEGNDAVMITKLMFEKSPIEYGSSDTQAKVVFKVIPACIDATAV